MRLFLFVLIIIVLVFVGFYYYNGQITFITTLGPSEACDAIVERQESPKLEDGESSYNNYNDGLRFILKFCFLR